MSTPIYPPETIHQRPIQPIPENPVALWQTAARQTLVRRSRQSPTAPERRMPGAGAAEQHQGTLRGTLWVAVSEMGGAPTL